MGDLSIATQPALADVHAPFRLSGIAGESLSAGNSVMLGVTGATLYGGTGVAVEGLIYKSYTVASGSGVTGISAPFEGVVINTAKNGDPVTVFQEGSILHIADATMSPGDFYYPSETGGAFSDAAIVTGEQPVIKAVTASEAVVVRMDKPAIKQAAS
jgi:hypothetical protein